MVKERIKDLTSILSTTGILSEIDIHFARFIQRLSNDQEPEIFLGAALVSQATANGDTCLDLDALSETIICDNPDGQGPVICPPAGQWRQKLLASPAVGHPGERCPLILDKHNRLYLYRYWEYEANLSAAIRNREQGELDDFDSRKFSSCLDRLFPDSEAEINRQKIAAVITMLKRFSVITGGPGSGKTYAIAGILALILELTQKAEVKLCLTAPTGKAAARLGESIMRSKRHLKCSSQIKGAIPGEVFTIHRLLKPVAGTPYFRHNADNPLSADVVVVDEASMVDMALMSKLIQAVAPDARLLLVGDKDQLASVEAGSVLGDICDRQVIHGFSKAFLKKIAKFSGYNAGDIFRVSEGTPGLQDCICVLKKNYRFSDHSGIGGICQAINLGDAEATLALLKNPSENAVEWNEFHSPGSLSRELGQIIIDGYRKYLTIKDPVLAMDAFNEFKILCALKIGPFGVNAVNRLAEQILTREKLIPSGRRGSHPWYRGRPIMITRNDYNLGLFNGDVGITLPDPDTSDSTLHVYFPEASGGVKRFLPHRLPEHETVYAMTVHKSQGSEFNYVVLILPDKDYPLMTRELIYTGVTRARKKVSIWGTESILATAIARKIERTSGLRDGLWT
jgi:exodeoxyribonuclease V alpha subunit